MDILTYGLLNKKVEEAKNVSGEKITEAVNTYLDENPPTAGATAEQAAQIDKNVADIGQLKSDINKLNDGGLVLKNEVIAEDVQAWLNQHPEATTTVQDNSLEVSKLTDNAKLYLYKDYVTPQMFGAKGDGVTDDTDAIQDAIDYAFDNGFNVYMPSGTYIISKPLLLWWSNAEVESETTTNKSVSLFGKNKKETIIKKVTNTLGTKNDHKVDSVIIVLNQSYIDDNFKSSSLDGSSDNIAWNGSISDLSIIGNAKRCEYGIYTIGFYFARFNNINIFNCVNGFYGYTWNCYSYYTDIGVNFANVGFNFGRTIIGSQTTMSFKNCHINGCSVKGFWIKGGARFENCSIDGGTCVAFYFDFTKKNNGDIFSRSTIVNAHYESATGSFLYANRGIISVISSGIQTSVMSDKPLISITNNSMVILTDVRSACRFVDLDTKANKFADVDASSVLVVKGFPISNALFSNYTKLNYKGLKELFNPSTQYTNFMRYLSNNAAPEDGSTLTIITENNEMSISFAKKSGGGIPAIQLKNKFNLSDVQRIVVYMSAYSETINSGSTFQMFLSDTLYEDGTVNRTSIGTSIMPNGLSRNLYENLKKEMIVFDVSNYDGEYYIGFSFGGLVDRSITLYDGYLI